jgi:hypothetical protein
MSRRSGDEHALVREAVRLACENAERGEQPFGALVVRDGRVVGTRVSTILRDGDPTAHAEMAAVRGACRSLGTLDLRGALLACSCEPWPMPRGRRSGRDLADRLRRDQGHGCPPRLRARRGRRRHAVDVAGRSGSIRSSTSLPKAPTSPLCASTTEPGREVRRQLHQQPAGHDRRHGRALGQDRRDAGIRPAHGLRPPHRDHPVTSPSAIPPRSSTRRRHSAGSQP